MSGLLANLPATDDGDLPVMPDSLPATVVADWRTEVTKRGGFWQWRKGSNGNRASRYGGKFELLPAERQEAYEQNKKTKARH